MSNDLKNKIDEIDVKKDMVDKNWFCCKVKKNIANH